MIYIETQKLINGVVNKGGKVYVGKYGLDPLVSANKLAVFDQSGTEIPGFGLTLNFNSDVIVNGEAKGIYAKESYSMQFIDADGAPYPKDFINVSLPVDAETSENWVKTLGNTSDNITITNDGEGNYQIDTGGLVDAEASADWVQTLTAGSPNIQVTTDGQGNYTIDASALGGGDVFQDGNNTYGEGTAQDFTAAELLTKTEWQYVRIPDVIINGTDSAIEVINNYVIDSSSTKGLSGYEIEVNLSLSREGFTGDARVATSLEVNGFASGAPSKLVGVQNLSLTSNTPETPTTGGLPYYANSVTRNSSVGIELANDTEIVFSGIKTVYSDNGNTGADITAKCTFQVFGADNVNLSFESITLRYRKVPASFFTGFEFPYT